MSARVAVPSKGRLRDRVFDLLRHAGYNLRQLGTENAALLVEDIEFIEMRPRDAAAWLRAGRLDAAFISTDTALENAIEDWPAIDLGFSRSDLVLACRTDSPYSSAAALAGKTVATHLPNWTRRWFDEQAIEIDVVAMGGSLEGICARGLADAIVDLRETGNSLRRNSLHVIEEGPACQAVFVHPPSAVPAEVDGLLLRMDAARTATSRQYLMMHIPPDQVGELERVFPGLAAPTLLPLAGRDDLVAVHLVVKRERLWANLADLRELGATGIVALPTDAILE
ncbi:MAG: ATP phosphoribosyltransferase [Acidimicrobiales bacterium]|nr:MAG: ATP phosphoribosyltransferase [Acidimicrobiales bacterium]